MFKVGEPLLFARPELPAQLGLDEAELFPEYEILEQADAGRNHAHPVPPVAAPAGVVDGHVVPQSPVTVGDHQVPEETPPFKGTRVLDQGAVHRFRRKLDAPREELVRADVEEGKEHHGPVAVSRGETLRRALGHDEGGAHVRVVGQMIAMDLQGAHGEDKEGLFPVQGVELIEPTSRHKECCPASVAGPVSSRPRLLRALSHVHVSSRCNSRPFTPQWWSLFMEYVKQKILSQQINPPIDALIFRFAARKKLRLIFSTAHQDSSRIVIVHGEDGDGFNHHHHCQRQRRNRDR